jgi:L-alanine-DL-glutamate epimerase-like enolase superfamily enzyme
MLDANESWSRKQAVRHVAELERTLDLIWVEEPVRRWDAAGMVAVGRAVRASIAAGENLTGLEQFRPLLTAGAVDVVQTAAGWGITHFLRVAALAHAYDLPVSGIGTTPIGLVHAATAVPNHMATELQDLSPAEGLSLDMVVEDGRFVLGDSPGLGLVVDEEAIALAEPPEGVPLREGPHIRPAQAGSRLDFQPPR